MGDVVKDTNNGSLLRAHIMVIDPNNAVALANMTSADRLRSLAKLKSGATPDDTLARDSNAPAPDATVLASDSNRDNVKAALKKLGITADTTADYRLAVYMDESQMVFLKGTEKDGKIVFTESAPISHEEHHNVSTRKVSIYDTIMKHDFKPMSKPIELDNTLGTRSKESIGGGVDSDHIIFEGEDAKKIMAKVTLLAQSKDTLKSSSAIANTALPHSIAKTSLAI